MRVAFVVGEFPSVSETFVLQQIVGLLEQGCDVRIFAARPRVQPIIHELYRTHNLSERTTYRELKVAPLKALVAILKSASHRRSNRDLFESLRWAGLGARRLGNIADIAAEAPFDIVHAQFGDIGRNVAPVLRLLPQSRLVTTFHGYDANVAPRATKQDLYADLFEAGHGFTANSDFLRRRLIQLGCAPDKIRIVRMGVDVERLRFTPRTRAEGEATRLLTVGRLIEAKGIAFAIRAVADLVARGYDLDYRIVGGGELRADLERLIGQLGVGGRVRLLGPKTQDEVKALYHDSHLLVLPSVRTPRGDEETQGTVVQEAQATGMPVIVSDIGGVREGIVEGRSGLVFRAGDVEDLAEKISTLWASSEQWQERGQVGRAFVEQTFSARAMTRGFLEFYRQLLSARDG